MSLTGLKRVLGLPEVSFIAIGMTIGGGVFTLTGIVLRYAGPALPLAYGLAVIPVFLSMLPLAMLGSALPAMGGNYRYPSRMVSPGVAFVGIWTYLFASFIGQIPLYAITCAKYLQVFFPEMSISLFSIGLLTFFFIVNVLGIRLAAQVQGIMVIVMITALVLYAGKGIVQFNPEHFTGFFQKGAGAIVLGTALLTFTYLGANGIIELGGDIKDPGRVIPRSFIISFAVVTLIYVGMAIATVGIAPWENLADKPEPLVEASGIAFGKPSAGFVFFVLGGAILAITTTLNALFIVGTKSLQAIISDGIVPAWMGKVHPRFGTAHILLAGIWILSIVGILSGFSLETFASYAALGGMIIFVPVLMASMILPRRYPREYETSVFRLRGFWLYFCPAVGFVMVLFFSAVILANLKSISQIMLFFGLILSGTAYYVWRKRWLRARGVDLDDIKKEENWTA